MSLYGELLKLENEVGIGLEHKKGDGDDITPDEEE